MSEGKLAGYSFHIGFRPAQIRTWPNQADDGRPSLCPQDHTEQRVAAELRTADDKLMTTKVVVGGGLIPYEPDVVESRKYGRVAIPSHEPHWRRPFAHAFSPLPRFGFWCDLVPTVSSAQRFCLYVQLSNGLNTPLSCCGPTFFGIREWSCWHVPVWPTKSKARYLASTEKGVEAILFQTVKKKSPGSF